MDFKGLEDDKVIQEKLANLQGSVSNIENLIDSALNTFAYDGLTVEEKVNYDLFFAYVLNTLYWIYLRTKGVDPNTTDVKHELGRIREYMVKAKMAHNRNTIRPKLNQKVAGRFVKHGISYSEGKDNSGKTDEPHSKRKKLA